MAYKLCLVIGFDEQTGDGKCLDTTKSDRYCHSKWKRLFKIKSKALNATIFQIIKYQIGHSDSVASPL